MTLLSEGAAQRGIRRGGGGGSSSASSAAGAARKTTPRRQHTKQKVASARSSPRLHLTQKRTPDGRGRGGGRRSASAARHQEAQSKRGGAAATGICHTNAGSRGGSGSGSSSGCTAAKTKKAAQLDGVAKIMKGLKGDLATAVQRAMEKVEAECGAFVSSALESCPAGVSGIEEEDATVEAALRKIEARQASVTSRCSGMLTAVENNRISLAAMMDRCRVTLDNLQQAESRKLKSSLDRATGLKS